MEAELVDLLSEQMAIQTNRRVGAGEQRSWSRGIPALVRDLRDANLGGVEMLFEYQLPLSSKRADVVLAGVHPKTGEPSYVVVELEQWSETEPFEDAENLVSISAYGSHGILHPGVQVAGYCEYLADFTASLANNPHSLSGVAYLHNATDKGVTALFNRPVDDLSRVFTGQRRAEFIAFLQSKLSTEARGADAADALIGSKIEPSRQLLEVAATEVQEREQFVLLDEQRTAYELVLHAIERARRANTKTAVVVTEGPGSGKSVIALSLMGELSRQGRSVMHATGSRSFTQTLRRVAGYRKPQVQKMFAYFNQFMTAVPNDLDCLILDEAHRTRETSVDRYTRKEVRANARPQVVELLNAARVPVFLLDEYQVMRPGEMGTVEDIEAHARVEAIVVERVDLAEQFRCGGSELYVDWVLRILGMREGGPIPWTGDDNFQVSVVDSPGEIESALECDLSEGYNARMAAGYCWPWSDPQRDGTLVEDMQIDGWSRPWNLKGERSVGGAPPSALWASDPAGFGQVGCVYTAQGFEYDAAGVIIGPDLVWRNGHWVSVREANRDPDFKSVKKVDDAQFDRLIRNVYKVLLTRGMRRVTIYSTDPQTRAFLHSLVRV